VPGGKSAWSIRAQACQTGECSQCPGWNSVWPDHPVVRVKLPKIPGGFGKTPTVELRCDPVLFSNDQFAYHVFQKLKRGKPGAASGDDDTTWQPGTPKAKTSELWTPVVGTRASFMAYLYHTFLVWREHRWHVEQDECPQCVFVCLCGSLDFFCLSATCTLMGRTRRQANETCMRIN
jgi:hypothetical protein